MHLLKSKDSKALQVRYSKVSVKLVILISKRLFCYAAPSISQNQISEFLCQYNNNNFYFIMYRSLRRFTKACLIQLFVAQKVKLLKFKSKSNFLTQWEFSIAFSQKQELINMKLNIRTKGNYVLEFVGSESVSEFRIRIAESGLCYDALRFVAGRGLLNFE